MHNVLLASIATEPHKLKLDTYLAMVVYEDSTWWDYYFTYPGWSEYFADRGEDTFDYQLQVYTGTMDAFQAFGPVIIDTILLEV